MKIDSTDMTVDTLLSQGWYKVPRFQRPYSWEKGNITEFWNDTVIENTDDYFIGSMVIYEDGQTTFGIVDGQQRLTTITILLCALRDVFYELGHKGPGDGVHTKVEKKNIESEFEFILKTETSFPYLQSYVQDKDSSSYNGVVSSEERNIAVAYTFYKTHILAFANKNKEKVDALRTIRDRILGLKIVLITLADEEDAYLIFEILNARGQDLDSADLIKNHLFRLIKKNNANYDSAQERWKEIVSTIQGVEASVKIEEFLHHFWMSRYAYVTKKDLYINVKRKAQKVEEAKGILQELRSDCGLYVKIIDPDEANWKREEHAVFRSLEAFTIFGIKQPMPAILSLIRAFETNIIKLKDLKRGLSLIEKFHFVHTAVCSERSSGSISTMYSNFGIELAKCVDTTEARKQIHELSKKLKKKLPSFDSFSSRFEEIAYRNGLKRQRKLVKYILEEFYKYESSGSVYPEKNTFNIEHLYPQASADTNEKLEYVGKVGNLLFCPEKVNGEIGNKSFVEKKKILTQKKCLLPEVVASASKWGKEEILQRTKEMGQIAYNEIWNS